MPRFSKLWQISLLTLVGIFALSIPAYSADWIDDWISQKTVYGGSSYETQKRGFASAGGASLRWRQSNDYLVTASKPQFKRGCGGIDVFLGGFSFLNSDLLVEKLQRIMGPAAATFAFDLALNTLCVQCSEEIKSLEAIIDRLNGLQIDDCRAQKAVTAILKDQSGLGGPAETEAVANFLQHSGVEDLWKNITDSGDNSTPADAALSYGVTKSQMVAGCPGEVRRVFFTSGSLLNNLATEKGIGGAYIEFIRGMIGDIRISSTLEYNFVPPCDLNADLSITDVMFGDVYVRQLSTENCVAISNISIGGSVYTSIYDYMYQSIFRVANALINKTQLAAIDQAFISTLPPFVYRGIVNVVNEEGADASAVDIASMYADIAGYLYTYSTLKDLFATYATVIDMARTIDKNKAGTDSGTGQNSCQLQLKDATTQELYRMRTETVRMSQLVEDQYSKKIANYLAHIQLQNEQRTRQGILRDSIVSNIIEQDLED